jgi:hypothetical protein
MKIKAIHFERLSIESHCQFLSDVKQLIDDDTSLTTFLAELLPPFYNLLTLEEKQIALVRNSVQSEELTKADQRRDRCLASIYCAVNMMLQHFDDTVAAAARKLKQRINTFCDDIENAAYEEKTTAVRVLLKELKTTYAEPTRTIGLDVWMPGLEKTQVGFDAIFYARNPELAKRPQGEMKDVCHKIEPNYHLIADKIDAYNRVNNDAFGAFTSQVNDLVDYFEEHGFYRDKSDVGTTDHTVIEHLETQEYIEKPVTPISVTCYHEKSRPVEVAPDNNFSVNYNNNIGVYMTEPTIYENGKYKEEKTTTFYTSDSQISNLKSEPQS